jgi:hypothetical protein
MTQAEISAAEELACELAGFDVPNLDDLSTDPRDYAAMERTLDKLSLYCEHKRRSMELRLQGDVDAALAYERLMERTYQRLPKWARW